MLTLDHRNGRNRDHRPENLRWLCPNCNSQTDTFAGRNASRRAPTYPNDFELQAEIDA